MDINQSHRISIFFINFVLFCSLFKIIFGRVELGEDVLEVLRRKTGNYNPDNRVMVGFKSQSDPMVTFQYLKSAFSSPEIQRQAAGEHVIQEMNAENQELERILLGIIKESQIVRRIPVGNVFILQDLTMAQSDIISQWERTAIFELSMTIEKEEVELADESKTSPPSDINEDLLKRGIFKDSKKGKGLKKSSDDDFLFGEPIYDVEKFASEDNWHPLHKSAKSTPSKAQWNIEKIKAPKCWALGYTGKGIIHAIIDSGVNFRHGLITKTYMGRKQDGTFDHNYAWYDAVGNINYHEDMVNNLRRPRWERRFHSYPFSVQEKDDSDNNETESDGQEAESDGYEADVSDNESEDQSFESSLDSEKSNEDSTTDEERAINNNTNNNNTMANSIDNTVKRSRVRVIRIQKRKLGDLMKFKTRKNGLMGSTAVKSLKQAAFKKCSIPSQEPCDNVGHGTHVISTALGSHGYGVAPEARWMACRSVTGNYGRAEDALACLNFFLAPHDLTGRNPRPELRPHIIGNSYGWDNWAEVAEVGIGLAVRRLEAAGTLMVFASGNTGPGCGTTHSAFSFTIGATSPAGTLAQFSSRGPWTTNPSWANRPPHPQFPYIIKPNVVAPGLDIIGGIRDELVAKMSGTSMATPHVSGAAALLLNACPDLIGKPDIIQSILQSTARKIRISSGNKMCGFDGVETVPNNYYGYGEIDVEAAILACRKK